MDMKIMKEIYDAYKKLGYDENAARMFAAYRMERLEMLNLRISLVSRKIYDATLKPVDYVPGSVKDYEKAVEQKDASLGAMSVLIRAYTNGKKLEKTEPEEKRRNELNELYQKLCESLEEAQKENEHEERN